MENKKINIAELLKDCPKGTKLYSPIFGEVYLDKISPHLAIIVTTDKYKEEFLYDGRYGMNGECMLFPSKGKTTWEGFVPPRRFKDGDVVATMDGFWIGITTGGKIDKFIPTYCVIQYGGKFEAYLDRKESWVFNRLATEEEKQKLFQAIKDNGYYWNTETKTLERLIEPKFKVGDKVVKKDNPTECWYVQGVDTNCNLDYFYHIVAKGKIANLHFKEQDDWELVPNKFDINTLVPFESKVLVRDINSDNWIGAFYSHYKPGRFYTIGNSYYYQCIPYEGNEHLLGTSNDCDEFYKNW